MNSTNARFLILALVSMLSILIPSTDVSAADENIRGLFFSESYEDTDLHSRGWYDGSKFKITEKDTYAGKGCIEYRWQDGGTSPVSSSGSRHLIEPTEVVYLRFYIRLSEGFGWSGRSYHPHMMHFLTTENSAYHGPAASHLTVYIEPVNGKLRLAATDIQNKDAPHGLTQGPLKGGYNGKFYDSKEVLFDDAKWHCVEAMFKLNTLDMKNDKPNRDGQVRGWFDGKLVIDHDDVIFRTTDFPKMKFNQFLVTPYFGPGLLPHAQTLWIDELAVAKEYIGPGTPKSRTAKIAVIQASGLPRQDPFMADYDPSKVRPQSEAHFEKLLRLLDKAGKMGADLVCGPEDMQHIAGYGLHVDVDDPETGEILFTSLVTSVPGPLTDKVAEIARRHRMYIIAPLYERTGNKVFNTAVIFDRQGNIMGKYSKTVLPVMETWLVSTGDEFPVFKTDFGTIAVAICWEIWFPEISTIYALKGADIIFNPTMGGTGPEGLSTAHRYITRAIDNSVYIVPVTLGTRGNGIIDFDGNVVAEAVGKTDTVIMAEIDFSKERINKSTWWAAINGTDNRKAIHFLSRRPETFKLLTKPNSPILERYEDVQLTAGDRKKQLEAVKTVNYGPKRDTN